MKHVIHRELYKNVYLTLFESHFSYGITAWGGISKNLLQPLSSIYYPGKNVLELRLAIKMLTWTNLKPVIPYLSYGITAWGGISKNLLQPLFITQKKMY